METKKKCCNVSCFIVLVIALLVCSITILLSSCSYAMTISDVEDYFAYIDNNPITISNVSTYYHQWYSTYGSTDFVNKLLSDFTTSELDNFSLMFIEFRRLTSSSATSLDDFRFYIYLYDIDFATVKLKINSNGDIRFYDLNDNIINVSRKTYLLFPSINSIQNYQTTSDAYLLSRSFYSNIFFFNKDLNIYDTNNNLMSYEQLQQYYSSNYYSNFLFYINVNLNTISLTATSNHKFGFTSRNQLYVEFTGDWTTSDFSFYIQKLNGSNWETVTKFNDYSVLTGYDNPYYIFWPDINYLPVGTYRYVADYGSLGTDLYYSNNFNITSSYVENETTGSIIDNGDGSSTIDINIDSGNTVDDVKDFMGGPADISDLDINSDTIHEAIGLQNQVNPYDNFVLTFFSGLTGALTTVTPQQFRYQVHDWGPIRNVSVADITPQYSYGMASFLSTVSSLVVVFVIVKWTTSIIESLNTADVSRTLELVEEKYSDLF